MNLRRHIAERLAGYGTVVAWGAGSSGRAALRKWLPRDRVASVIDGNPDKAGTVLEGRTVHGPEDLSALNPDLVVICSDAYQEILEQLDHLGYRGTAVHMFDLFPADDQGPSEFDKLRIDIARQIDRNPLSYLLFRPQILVNVTYRLTRQCAGRPVLLPLYAVMRVLHTLVCVFFSISLPPSVRAGGGLLFPHFGTVVFHPAVRLGRCCTIYHCATIGSNDGGGVPELADFVTVYTGALVLGATRLGPHTRVGAQTMLSDFVCEGRATVVGRPPRVARAFGHPQGTASQESPGP
ncbi:MAG: hypothetical protein KDE22_02820 [Rhodobacterales bacterium]|nr:hypothetical protein [Rhodobacterales bacterium]